MSDSYIVTQQPTQFAVHRDNVYEPFHGGRMLGVFTSKTGERWHYISIQQEAMTVEFLREIVAELDLRNKAGYAGASE